MAGSMAANACAALLTLTALVHSVLGEIRLISPLLTLREGILKHDLARFLLRVVWHMMSIVFVILAIAIAALPHGEQAVRTSLLAATGAGIGGAGVIDAIGSRGKHIGWPMLVAIGATALLALRGA